MKIPSIIRNLPLLAACLLVVPPAVAFQTDCNDEEAEAGWSTLLHKYPDDYDLREFYRLRQRLCRQVEENHLPLAEASERFEEARQRLIQKWQEQNQRRGVVAGGAG